MLWLQEIFFELIALMAYITVIPVVGIGILLAWIAPRMSGSRLRVLAVGFVGVAAVCSLSFLFYRPAFFAVAFFLLPVVPSYPYLHSGSILFVWIPIGAEMLYVIRKPLPKPLIAGLIGFCLVAINFILLLVIAASIGAEMD